MAYIELRQATMRFGTITAVDQLDVDMAKGE